MPLTQSACWVWHWNGNLYASPPPTGKLQNDTFFKAQLSKVWDRLLGFHAHVLLGCTFRRFLNAKLEMCILSIWHSAQQPVRVSDSSCSLWVTCRRGGSSASALRENIIISWQPIIARARLYSTVNSGSFARDASSHGHALNLNSSPARCVCRRRTVVFPFSHQPGTSWGRARLP